MFFFKKTCNKLVCASLNLIRHQEGISVRVSLNKKLKFILQNAAVPIIIVGRKMASGLSPIRLSF